VPQVMLFQKIVSNLGALFSMQTPLGSWTIQEAMTIVWDRDKWKLQVAASSSL